MPAMFDELVYAYADSRACLETIGDLVNRLAPFHDLARINQIAARTASALCELHNELRTQLHRETHNSEVANATCRDRAG